MSNDNQMETDPYGMFQAGDKVRHPKFGEGQIIQRSGTGDNTKFVVKFVEEGEKRLLACFAKLKRIQPVDERAAEKQKAALDEKARKAALVPEKEVDEIEKEELDDDDDDELEAEGDGFVELASDDEDIEEPVDEDDRFEN
jgi:hypothetical protein